MVEMSIDGPSREDHIGTFHGKQAAERFSSFGIDHGAAVDLPCEDRFGTHNPAGGDTRG
jgi:hypothetical protein